MLVVQQQASVGISGQLLISLRAYTRIPPPGNKLRRMPLSAENWCRSRCDQTQSVCNTACLSQINLSVMSEPTE